MQTPMDDWPGMPMTREKVHEALSGRDDATRDAVLATLDKLNEAYRRSRLRQLPVRERTDRFTGSRLSGAEWLQVLEAVEKMPPNGIVFIDEVVSPVAKRPGEDYDFSLHWKRFDKVDHGNGVSLRGVPEDAPDHQGPGQAYGRQS